MRIPKPIARMLLLAPLFFGLFMLLGATGFYPPLFRAMGNTFLHRFGSGRIARFERIVDPVGIADTGVSIGTDSKGVPAYGATIKISTVREGYAPTAVIAALVLATPIPWPKRGRMLLVGLLAVQGFVAFRMVVLTLYGFSRLGVGDHHLLEVGALGRTLLRRADQVVSTDMHVSYIVPFLVWIVLAITITDLRTQFQPMGAREEAKLQTAAKRST